MNKPSQNPLPGYAAQILGHSNPCFFPSGQVFEGLNMSRICRRTPKKFKKTHPHLKVYKLFIYRLKIVSLKMRTKPRYLPMASLCVLPSWGSPTPYLPEPPETSGIQKLTPIKFKQTSLTKKHNDKKNKQNHPPIDPNNLPLPRPSCWFWVSPTPRDSATPRRSSSSRPPMDPRRVVSGVVELSLLSWAGYQVEVSCGWVKRYKL